MEAEEEKQGHRGDRLDYMGLHPLPALGSPIRGSKTSSNTQVAKF